MDVPIIETTHVLKEQTAMSKFPAMVRLLAIMVWLVFVMNGAAKLTSQPAMVQQFDHFGYAQWFLYAVGLIETLLGIGLLVPKSLRWAALGLIPVMAGAVVSHVMHDPPDAVLPAGGLMLVLAYLVWRTGGLRTQESGGDD